MDPKILGKIGEDLAEKFLRNKGYKILERNWKSLHKELDIIAKKSGAIIFVEVKTIHKTGDLFDRKLAEENVGQKKIKNLISASKSYILSKKISQETPWQIDVISVEKNEKTGDTEIHHFENAVY